MLGNYFLSFIKLFILFKTRENICFKVKFLSIVIIVIFGTGGQSIILNYDITK